MERLTTKVDDIYTCSYCENQEAINKLAEFEDFMEEQGFESLEELKKCFGIWNSEDDNGFLKDTDSRKLFLYRFAKNLYRYEKEENYALKDKWQKLKEWCRENCYVVEECCGDVESDYYEEYINEYINIAQLFEKMQELEKEIK